ncbi:hypothetical protein G3I77_11545 [Streptomyces sp. D2-8]|uniref:hypothetical protein n=1 Tax=Streptomyces sp. D2-8 TaxID=2707767 RepID=UPI0020C115F0|nr:hypothetical protein [Streptomyces sp. D2-8]MCK8433648.1 hypothetical protein [Streptomyces sp. D2-8]
MNRTKSLIKHADPVPGSFAGEASLRAVEQLTGRAAGAPPQRRSAWRRRGLLVAAGLAAAGAGVVAVVVALNGSPGSPGGSGMADEIQYSTTPELEDAAQLIVRARLGAGREETTDGYSKTIAEAGVVATAKGRAPGGSIEVSYTTPGSGPETAALAEGREYVFLLEKEEDGDGYFLVNSTQGAYGIEADRPVAGPANDVALSAGVLKALRLTGTG